MSMSSVLKAPFKRVGMQPTAPQKAKGFTLLELLVVLIILGLLATVVGPNVWNALAGSKEKTAKTQLHEFEQTLDLFKLDVGRYPTDAEGLQSLLQNPGSAPGWHGPYLRRSPVPTDPWGKPYVYKATPGGFSILSLGADGQPGGEGDNADITN